MDKHNDQAGLPWSKYFSSREWAIYSTLLLLGVVLRWTNLDARPFHHDESLYAVYGDYAFSDPVNKFYRYLPILHGPFLFHLLSFVYGIFGVSHWSARAPMAAIGTLLVIMPFLFRKHFLPGTLLILTLFLSLSPSFAYWSRFIGHDLYIFFFMAMMILPITFPRMPPFLRAFFPVLGMVMQFCIKENAYVTLAILLGFLIYEAIYKKHFEKDADDKTAGEAPWLAKIISHINQHPGSWVAALALGSFIYCYFYSAGFVYFKGIPDGLYRESLSYWSGQHKMERIKGPFLFQFIFLSWYEPLFIAALFVYLIHFYRRASRSFQLTALINLILAMVIFLFNRGKALELSPEWYAELFKLKLPIDVFGPILLVTHAVLATTWHLRERNGQLAFFGYIFFSFFFTYSFVGEKVPWLSLYILLPGTIYLGLYFQNTWTRAQGKSLRTPASLMQQGLSWGFNFFICTSVVVGLQSGWERSLLWVLFGCLCAALQYLCERLQEQDLRLDRELFLLLMALFYLRTSIITNFSRAGSETELISQVHTSKVFHDINLFIRNEIAVPHDGRRPRVLVESDPIWPSTWYFRDLPEYSFRAFAEDKSRFDYVICRDILGSSLRETHNLVAIPLRGWWVPDFASMTFDQYLRYAFDHTPWGPTGSLFVTFASRKHHD